MEKSTKYIIGSTIASIAVSGLAGAARGVAEGLEVQVDDSLEAISFVSPVLLSTIISKYGFIYADEAKIRETLLPGLRDEPMDYSNKDNVKEGLKGIVVGAALGSIVWVGSRYVARAATEFFKG